MTTTETPTTEYIDACPVGRIRVDPINPRTHITVDDDFVASIASGILEPLIVRVDPANPQLIDDEGPVDFLLVAGHRRHLAATQADLPTVPVVVRHDLTDDRAALVAMIVENGQRENLPPLDEARGIETLVGMGMSQREAAKAIGREQGTVSKRLSLLKLPQRAQALLDTGRITVKTALGLTGLVKDDGKLSDVLDWAAQHETASDADIAGLTFRRLQSLKDERDRQQREKKAEKFIPELVGRGLEHIDDVEDDNWEECDEADATAFEVDRGEIIWLKPYVAAEPNQAPTEKRREPAQKHATTATPAEASADDEQPTSADSVIADAARDYVAARHAAHQNGELEDVIAVDTAWEHLRLACGYSHTDFEGEDVPSTVVAEPTPDIATIEPEKLEEPWRGYDAFGITRIVKVINSNDPLSHEKLQACIAYERANSNRTQIIAAAEAKLAQLTPVNA